MSKTFSKYYYIHELTSNKCIYIYEKKQNLFIYIYIKLSEAHVTCAVYNHNGTEIVASYNNEDIYLFDTAIPYQSGDFAHKYQGHRNSVTGNN
jgi:hypothetical protein